MQLTTDNFKYPYHQEEIVKKHHATYEKWKWIVLIGCFFLQMFPYCVSVNLTKVFAGDEWIKWMNGNPVYIGLGFTVATIVASFAAPFIAKLFNKDISMRLIYGIGVTAATLGFGMIGLNALIPTSARHIPVVVAILWTGNIISQIGIIIFSGLGINNLIIRWWPSNKRGLAFGLAFAGGSAGNIWMQYLVGQLSSIFHNNPGQGNAYQPAGEPHLQFLTYLIFALIGLVFGLLVILVICRKEIPPVYMFEKTIKEIHEEQQQQSVNFLYTKNYPGYWLLCIGFMMIQIASIQSSQSSAILNFYVLAPNGQSDQYNVFVQHTGIVYGVACLIGNIAGGILSQKLKPNNGLLIACCLQLMAIFTILYAIYIPNLVFLYYILQGLCCYIYTSLPSMMCGTLYGKQYSNSHIAILGMFTGIGFAITNSTYGFIVGDYAQDVNQWFGYEIHGNVPRLLIFCIVFLIVGSILAYTSSTIMLKKGVSGLKEYSPTKYSQIIFWKHAAAMEFCVLAKIWFNKDVKLAEKNQDDYQAISKVINHHYHKVYSSPQKACIAHIYCYHCLPNNCSPSDVQFLVTSNVIAYHDMQWDITDTTLCAWQSDSCNDWFFKGSKKQRLNTLHWQNINQRIDAKLAKKIKTLNTKIARINAESIDSEQQSKYEHESSIKYQKYATAREKLMQVSAMDEWKRFEKEYWLIIKMDKALALKTKLINAKEAKLKAVNQKIIVAQYSANLEKQQQLDGYHLLNDYYQNPSQHCQHLIDKKIALIETQKQAKKQKRQCSKKN